MNIYVYICLISNLNTHEWWMLYQNVFHITCSTSKILVWYGKTSVEMYFDSLSQLMIASALFRVPQLTELAIKASQSIFGTDWHWMKAFQSFPHMGWSPDLCSIPTSRCNLLFYTSNNGTIHTGLWQPVCFTVMAMDTWHLIRWNLTVNNAGPLNIKAQKWFQIPFFIFRKLSFFQIYLFVLNWHIVSFISWYWPHNNI